MKVAFESRAEIEKTGIGTYVRELKRCLMSIGPDVELVSLPGLENKLWLPFWLHWVLPHRIKQIRPDVVHFTKSDIPMRVSVPSVVTIYDLIPLHLPETQSFLRRLYWPRALRRAALASDHIVTISEASKNDLITHFHVAPEKITVTRLAVDLNHFTPTTQWLPDLPVPYILFVGRWDARKNIGALIRAFASIADRVPHNLVIAGSVADKPVNLAAAVQKAGVVNRVLFREHVPYANLPALYSGADLFVYPSVIEGWGFPPQEAMACGTPVIVSDGKPLPEVVGEAGSIVPFTASDVTNRLRDNAFVQHLADEMLRILTSSELQASMSRAGLQHVQSFQWTHVAKQTLDVYTAVTVASN